MAAPAFRTGDVPTGSNRNGALCATWVKRVGIPTASADAVKRPNPCLMAGCKTEDDEGLLLTALLSIIFAEVVVIFEFTLGLVLILSLMAKLWLLSPLMDGEDF